ncbi:alpha/beta fold hydrolase [Caulobacter segnis]|uniref:alpha/beta fold hydrolase n=1 Tax=Caulobacter segnis TaxID=88688 RepID=UPI00240F2CCE|nr:alpha/beta fold hydrolase [Caulobacter segnis]MDG2522573.1 alpha/beta fold hydrolase [Caulobacter segnis]
MPVVLTPGYMLDADLWTDIAPAFAPYGPVSQADVTRDGTIEAMAERLLDEAPDRFVLIGFSMGGYVAREAVRRAPERVSALALIATSARGDNHIQAARRAAVAGQMKTEAFKGLSLAAVAASLAPGAAPALAERVRKMSARLGYEVFRRQSALVRDGDVGRLGEIACPTLVVAAAQDQLRSLAEAEQLRDGIPGARLAVIEGSGHMIPLEAAGALSRLLADWLAEVASEFRT